MICNLEPNLFRHSILIGPKLGSILTLISQEIQNNDAFTRRIIQKLTQHVRYWMLLYSLGLNKGLFGVKLGKWESLVNRCNHHKNWYNFLELRIGLKISDEVIEKPVNLSWNFLKTIWNHLKGIQMFGNGFNALPSCLNLKR